MTPAVPLGPPLPGFLGRLADTFTADPYASPAMLAERLTASWAPERRWLPARHLQLLDQALVDVVEGRCPRLMVWMPPRHGKSELTSRWTPLWTLRRWPHRRVVVASHSLMLAEEHGRFVRDMVAEHGPALGLALSKASSSASRWNLDGTGGGFYAIGMGGALTGRGADLLIIDDPVAKPEDVGTQQARDAAWDWWDQVATTRLEPHGAIVLVQTRWDPDDLAGRVLARDAQSWRVISLPALAEDDDPMGREPGDALWPERWPAERLNAIRAERSARVWQALYQQRPTPLEGLLFHRDAIERNRITRDQVPELVTVREYVDPAFARGESGDETGRIVMGSDGDCVFVFADLSSRAAYDELPLGDTHYAWGTTQIVIETNLLGVGIVDVVAENLVALGYRFSHWVGVRGIRAKLSKAMRAESVSALVDNDRVKFVGQFERLEAQLTGWRAGSSESPDRLDAFVHGVTDMLIDGGDGAVFRQRPRSPFERARLEAIARQNVITGDLLDTDF